MGKHPFGDVAEDVVRIIDWESLGLPPRHGAVRSFRGLTRRLWFDSEPDLSRLWSVFIYLAIYGFVDRAVPAALALRGVVAGTKNVQYSYVSGCVTTTCCFAERAGWDPDAVADLRELALDSPGRTFRPGPLALDGSMLKDPVDHLDRYPEGFPPAGQALQDIAMLAGLWVWGSTNPAWTRPRIAERIGVNMAWLHTLKRWEPWK